MAYGGPPLGGGLGFSNPNHLDTIKRGWDYHPEEHRNLPPAGVAGANAPSPQVSPPNSGQPLLQGYSQYQNGLAPSMPEAQATPPGGGSHIRITVPQLFDGRLGLIIQNCWISAISNPTAAQYGWQVGDHILSVNGHPVSTMPQLSEEIRRSLSDEMLAVSHPLIFDVWRPAPAGMAVRKQNSIAPGRRSRCRRPHTRRSRPPRPRRPRWPLLR
ncbi:PDZ domain-containing protein [Durusdinium trenchii]|uniref:PDZ domain-containing protein n=1 Tax=Durusdinium trenchii TaxID=1381693 RepID=A0ABP0PGT1_9DINO